MTEASPASDVNVEVPAAQVADTTIENVERQDANTPAESSTADDKGSNAPGSMLEAVQKAIKSSAPAGNSPNPEGSSDDPQGQDDNSELPTDVSDEELRGYHSKTRRRVKQLVDRAKTAEGRAQQYEQSAESWGKVETYIQKAGLNYEEVNTGFEIMRLMKNEPEKALEALVPYVQMLYQTTGRVLPPDLKQRVDQGLIDEQTANEVSQHLARQQHMAAAAQRATEEATARMEHQRIETFSHNVGTTISELERTWAKSDPDYKVKQPHVMKEVELQLLKNGVPQTVQAAAEMFHNARKAVDDNLRPLVQQNRREIRPVTAGGSIPSTAKPKSLLEAMTQAVNR